MSQSIGAGYQSLKSIDVKKKGVGITSLYAFKTLILPPKEFPLSIRCRCAIPVFFLKKYCKYLFVIFELKNYKLAKIKNMQYES